LKATNFLKTSEERLKETIYNIEENRKKMGLLNSIMLGLREPVLIIVIAASILIQINYFGGSLSALLISLLFFYRALNSVSLMQTAWNVYLSTLGSFENIKKLQKSFENNIEPYSGSLIKSEFSYIQLNDVDLFFDDKKIINKLNLKIEARKTHAFIGESGSGKSTLINLIVGLMPPDYGTIKMDNVSYKDLNINKLQNRVGYITQEPIVFNDSIYNNITLWSPKTKKNVARFEEVLQKSSIGSFISSLPNKEETELGNSGITLSGGQKQRISIARELYKNIDILIMDEATSALDTETEKEIQNNIDKLKGEYTIIIAAHRLSTIKNADKIIYINNGCVEKEGTFSELMENFSSFRKLIETQNLKD
jgi:subfamily B ATP-binding cassette protein MsbA